MSQLVQQFLTFLEGLTPLFSKYFLSGIKLSKKSVHFLYYADDLVILAHSKEALQEKIRTVSNFFNSMFLNVNIPKTQVVVFKRGGQVPRKEKFDWRGVELEVVKEYKYLGVVFTSTGVFKRQAENAVQKGLAATGTVLSTIKRPRTFTLNTTTKLLNSIIHSTCLYGSEIWGMSHDTDLERVQQTFIKRVLQLPMASPGYFIRRETATLHTRFRVLKQAFNFWIRILTSREDSLIRAAYDELRRVSASEPQCETRYSWCKQLESALIDLNLHKLWVANSATRIVNSKPIFLNSLESLCKLKDSVLISNSSFIPHYNTIKPSRNPARYLNFKLPLHTVRIIAQLRLNLSTIYFQDRFFDLGMWERMNCKFCGDELSLSHALHECNSMLSLRYRFRFPICTDQESYLRFLSDLSNKQQDQQTYNNICVFVKLVIKNYV